MTTHCSDVCEAVDERLMQLGLTTSHPPDDSHDDILEALGKVTILKDEDILFLVNVEDIPTYYNAVISIQLEAEGADFDPDTDFWEQVEPGQRETLLANFQRLLEGGNNMEELMELAIEMASGESEI